MVKLSRSLCTDLMHQIAVGSEEWYYWIQNIGILCDTAGVEVLHDNLGDSTPWVRTTNSTTAYTTRYIRFLGDEPHDNWGLIDAMLYEYDATNNKTGATVYISGANLANDKMGVQSMGQNDTAFTALSFPGDVALVVRDSWGLANQLQWNDGTSTDGVGPNLIFLPGAETYRNTTTIGKDQWDDYEILAYVNYWK